MRINNVQGFSIQNTHHNLTLQPAMVQKELKQMLVQFGTVSALLFFFKGFDKQRLCSESDCFVLLCVG